MELTVPKGNIYSASFLSIFFYIHKVNLKRDILIGNSQSYFTVAVLRGGYQCCVK